MINAEFLMLVCASILIPFLLMTKGEKSDDLYHFDSMTYMNCKSLCDTNVLYALQNL